MYKKKDDLKILIDSLSVAEKRYFGQYLKALNHQKTPFYLTLFSALSSSESLPPGKTEKVSEKMYTNAKARLYKHLVRCLRIYHDEKSIDTVIQNLLCEIEVLYDRGLPEQSLLLLKKAHTYALLHEAYGLMPQILIWERKLNIILNTPTRTNKEIAQEEKAILKNLNQVIELENIYSKVMEIKKKHGYVKGAVKKQLDKIVLENPNLNKWYRHHSTKGKYYYYFIHAMYHFIVSDQETAYQYSKELLTLETKQIAPHEYLEGVLQHTTSCMSLSYFEETHECLELADAFIQKKNFDHRTSFMVKLFYFQTCYTLITYLYMGRLKELEQTIKQAEEKIIIYDKILSIEMKLVIYGNLRNAYIAAGIHDQAERLLNILLYKESKWVRSDVYNDLFLSRLFSYLAAGTYVLVPAMALAAYRQYRQTASNEEQIETGLKLSSVLMKDYNYEDQATRTSVLLALKNILLQSAGNSKRGKKFHEMYTFYLIWINSMLHNQPFHIAAQEWYKYHLETIRDKKSGINAK